MQHCAILFDLDQNWIGGSYYIKNLVSALGTLPDKEQPELTLISSNRDSHRFIRETGYRRLNWITRAQFDERPDAFPFDAIFPWPIPGQEDRTVSWIPDFQEHHLPMFFTQDEIANRRHHHRLRFNTAGLVVSSNDVRADVDRFYPGECPNVEVVQFATFNTFDFSKFPEVSRRYDIDGPYVMCPNQVWVHKNHIVVIKAVALLAERGIDVRVYCTGNESDYRVSGYSGTLKRLIAEWGLSDRIRFLGFIPREDQLILMKGASYIVQPSLFEGWSTVVEDAKAMNQFVVASDLRVHEEQLDRDFELFPASNPSALAEIMARLDRTPPRPVGRDYREAQHRFGRDFIKAVTKFTGDNTHPRRKGFMSVDEVRAISRANIGPETDDRAVAVAVAAEAPAAAVTRTVAVENLFAGIRPAEISTYFDATWYKNRYGLTRLSDAKALRHFLGQGLRRNHAPNALFDVDHYLHHYGDVAAARSSAFEHFLKHGASEGRWPNALFDPTYYLEQYTDVAQAGLEPFGHFLRSGMAEGRSPHPLFDVGYYSSTNPDVRDSGIPPFVHFLLYGMEEGRTPHPLFDADFYVTHHADVAGSGIPPFVHFLRYGLEEGRSPHRFFDPKFYFEIYPDAAASGLPALIHFLRWGMKENRRTHPLFSPELYLGDHPDVAAEGFPALLHFILHGRAEERRPHPLFDPTFYRGNNPDVGASGMTALDHFVEFGVRENRRPHPLFDPTFYMRRYADVRESGIPALMHFLEFGLVEGRSPNPYFDAAFYSAAYPDVAESGTPAFLHYLLIGDREARQPSAAFDPKFYLDAYPDVRQSDYSALAHYLLWGRKEGRSATPHSGGTEARRYSDPLEYYVGGGN